jgi:hypothetical protein
VTVSVTVVVCVAEVPAPVTVTAEVPVGVAAAAVMVSVELAPAVTLVGLNDAVAPAGSPEAERATVWGEPLVTAVEIVVVALDPWLTVTPGGLAPMEKSSAVGAPVKDTSSTRV